MRIQIKTEFGSENITEVIIIFESAYRKALTQPRAGNVMAQKVKWAVI